MRVFLSINEFDDKQLQRLQDLTGQTIVQRHNYNDDAPLESDFNRCEIVFGNVPATWLTLSKKLRWVQLDSVGFGEYRALDWLTLGQQVTVTNLAGFFADQVAESVLAGILALYRGVDQLVLLREKAQWLGDPLRTRLRCLTGARVLLFGFGTINQRVAELLQPYACSIQSFARNWEVGALDQAISESDIVVSTVPETDLTKGVFDQHRLSLLGASGIFINFGRGSVVDEDALVTALQSGSLGGAVIDVTNDEPLPPQHPLWSTPNTILTQHTGGGSVDELDRKIDVFADNFARYKTGRSLQRVVDFERGY